MRFLMCFPVLLAACGLAGSLAAQEAAPVPESPAQDAVQAPPAAPAASPAREQNTVVTGDRTIESGSSVDGVVVVDGDLRIRGEVTGDAVVLNGNLILESSGVVLGDALVTNGRIVNEGGRVRGEMLSVEGGSAGRTARSATVVSGDSDRNASASVGLGRDRGGDSWFRPIRRGIAGIISTLAFALVLGGIGAALVFYAKPQLETVSDTIRASTLRAGATGLAATFLIVPAFVVLVVALAVSIIGIPLLIVAVPLYPLAIFAAILAGLLAASHSIGERTAEQSRNALDLRYRNSYAYLFTGVAALTLPIIVAHLLTMTGFLGFIGILLQVVTALVIWAAATVGLGAVILSYGGRRRSYAGATPEAVGLDSDEFFVDPTLGGDDHV